MYTYMYVVEWFGRDLKDHRYKVQNTLKWIQPNPSYTDKK